MASTVKHHENLTDSPVLLHPPAGLILLLGLRFQLLRNHFREIVYRRPLKLLGAVASIVLIWVGLYFFLVYTFRLVNQSVLEGIVAKPLIFTFFFLVLTMMLAFSSAILSYGGLFRRPESVYLLTTPLHPRDVVTVRYFESLVLSSWSLLLLGLPLMMAMAEQFSESWEFYPLFMGIFLLFIPLPVAVGMFLAWVVAMVFPRTPKRILLVAAMAVLGVGGWWLWRIYSSASLTSNLWLKNLYDRVGLIQNSMLPHMWVSKGLINAAQGQLASAGFYLFILFANALFAGIVVVGIVSRVFTPAFSRAHSAGTGKTRRSGRIIALAGEVLFAYLPKKQRMLAVKDIKTFFRDPLQWSQMAILLGLLVLYVGNVQRLWVDLAEPRLQLVIAFLNLTAVSLIMATFTSRFVFPLVSLEGQQLWLLGLLPLPRSRMIVAKFLYALTITLIAALGVMGISVYRLDLPGPLAIGHLICSAAVCVGLCGVSIGMGARLPVFNERNPARIAGGFGGTVSLFVSVMLVAATLVAMGLMSYQSVQGGYGEVFVLSMVWWLLAVITVNVIAAFVAMFIGVRHFKNVQC
ncbi:MAG: putative ABC transporter permease subunit [Planctomycetota bacterium]|jgi:ABC-2 type transport system permease protein